MEPVRRLPRKLQGEVGGWCSVHSALRRNAGCGSGGRQHGRPGSRIRKRGDGGQDPEWSQSVALCGGARLRASHLSGEARPRTPQSLSFLVFSGGSSIPHTKHFMFMTSLREGTIIRPIFEMRKLRPGGLW